MLFMTDIVLNHTSTNSPLIQQDLSITFNNFFEPALVDPSLDVSSLNNPIILNNNEPFEQLPSF